MYAYTTEVDYWATDEKAKQLSADQLAKLSQVLRLHWLHPKDGSVFRFLPIFPKQKSILGDFPLPSFITGGH